MLPLSLPKLTVKYLFWWKSWQCQIILQRNTILLWKGPDGLMVKNTFAIKIRDLLKKNMIPRVWKIAARPIIIMPISESLTKYFCYHRAQIFQACSKWVSDLNIQIIINRLIFYIKSFEMFSSQYKSLVHKFGLSSRNHCNLLNLRKNQYNSNAFGSLVGSFLNKYQFSSKKPSILT